MLDYIQFVTQDKSMLIAPAGFGKTHTIAECLKNTQGKEKQLVLTHTHAGVASINEKIKKEGVPYSNYEVETITSFVQRFVLAFYIGDIPKQEEPKKYYPFLIEKATKLFKLKPIRQIISNTYNGLFVDEYQDCTKKQHELILLLSELFPTRILGDPWQGIFGFKGEQLVDMTCAKEMKEFSLSKYELDKPQRWLNGNNALLGESLKSIRELIKCEKAINLFDYSSSLEIHTMKKSDEFFEFEIKNGNGDKMKNPLNKKIWDLKRESSLLVLYPNNEKNRKSGPRELFIKIFGDDFKLLEAIDNELFYKYSTLFDKSNCQNIEENINTVLAKCYTKKGINKWFNNSTLQSDELTLFNAIQLKIEKLSIKIDNNQISDVLRSIHSLGGMKCIRKEVIYSLIAALQNSDIDKCSVFEAMVNKRNTIRRIGRKVIGKCVGTTLLTKGLEFDTVAIMNAHEFDCPKHLYVALTRACKRLIVFTSNPILKPYK